MIRSANPVFDKEAFLFTKGFGEKSMTVQGVANKTLILIAILLFSGYFLGPLISLESRMSFVLAIVAVFALLALGSAFRHLAWLIAPIFAVVSGSVIASLVIGIENNYPGVALQAFMLTVSILLSLLVLYKLKVIDASENMKLMIASGTTGIAIVYGLQLFLRANGFDIIPIHESGFVGIGFSVFAVVMASMNIVMDFDYIEDGERNNCSKSLEWYSAFGLTVTLIWLYFEILHLLTKGKEGNGVKPA